MALDDDTYNQLMDDIIDEEFEALENNKPISTSFYGIEGNLFDLDEIKPISIKGIEKNKIAIYQNRHKKGMIKHGSGALLLGGFLLTGMNTGHIGELEFTPDLYMLLSTSATAVGSLFASSCINYVKESMKKWTSKYSFTAKTQKIHDKLSNIADSTNATIFTVATGAIGSYIVVNTEGTYQSMKILSGVIGAGTLCLAFNHGKNIFKNRAKNREEFEFGYYNAKAPEGYLLN